MHIGAWIGFLTLIVATALDRLLHERSLRDPAAILDPIEIRWVRGHAPHRLLQRQHLALPHPGPQHVGRIARVAQHVEVRAAVRSSAVHSAIR